MSPPAQKARSPAPRTTTRVTRGSAAQSASAFARSVTMPWVSAFSAAGRFSVTSPAGPWRSQMISGGSVMASG